MAEAGSIANTSFISRPPPCTADIKSMLSSINIVTCIMTSIISSSSSSSSGGSGGGSGSSSSNTSNGISIIVCVSLSLSLYIYICIS